MRKYVLPIIVALQALKMYLVMYERGHGWYLSHVAYSLDERPYVYRVLIPFLSRVLERMTGIQIVYCLGFLFVLSSLFFYFSAKYFYESFSPDGEIPALVGFQVLFLITIVETKVYDYATAAFFALLLGLLARNKHGVFLLLFPIATLNRETTFLLTIFYLIWFFRKMPLLDLFASLFIQTMSYVTVKFFVQSLFVNNGGQSVYFELWHVLAVYKEFWATLLVLIPIFYLLVRSWKNYPRYIRVVILVFLPIQIVLHILFGKAFEIRVFAESIFLVFSLFHSVQSKTAPCDKIRAVCG